MEPYDPGLDPGELGGVGEGLCPVDSAQPLTRCDKRSKIASLAASPKGEGHVVGKVPGL
jgi:hypothetical protein